jgi:hypothetical protein
LITLAWPLQRFNKKINDLISQDKALDIDELNQLAKEMRSKLDEVQGLPIHYFILHLLSEIVLHPFIVVFTEQL